MESIEEWNEAVRRAQKAAQERQEFDSLISGLFDVFKRTHRLSALSKLHEVVHDLLYSAGGGSLGNVDAESKAIRKRIEEIMKKQLTEKIKDPQCQPTVMRHVPLHSGGKCTIVVHTSVQEN